MKYSNWKISGFSPSSAQTLARHTGSSLLGAVLSARGVETAEEADALLYGDIRDMPDPFLLKDMGKAASRIQSAIDNREQVAVYGDYDVDGITATCLMVSFLRQNGLDPQIHIPNRLEEGYGLNKSAIESLAAGGVTLIITVDCGITSVEESNFSKSIGIDMVISDHHKCKEELPDAVAVVDPRRPDCEYPYKDLAGVGVAFKIICAIERSESAETLACRYGDLVAIGTIADLMPITGENRILVRHGLRSIGDGLRPGLTGLISSAGLDMAKITSENVSFGIAPRINAAGRMGQTEAALQLLLTTDPDEADMCSQRLATLNDRRKQVEGEITEQALGALREDGYEGGPIIMASEMWHNGVAGIVASRLLDRYQEPVIIICLENGEGRGSCRSCPGFNLFEALKWCEGSLLAFGGHELAAGLTVREDRLEEFKLKFQEYYDAHPPGAGDKCLNVDFSVKKPEFLSMENVTSLDELAPFGSGNPPPTLALENAALREVTPIGGDRHLRIRVEKWGQIFECVYFGMTKADFFFGPGQGLDIAFTPKINSFRDRRTVQLVICDVRPPNWGGLHRELELCRRFYGGEQISSGEAGDICPGRRDFATLWRYLIKSWPGEVISGNSDELLSDLTAGIGSGSAGKYYICLKVMDELGLAVLREDGEALSITMTPSPDKVDLEESAALRKIRSVQGSRGEVIR